MPNQAQLKLETKFTQDDDALVISYRVTNPGPGDVYLMNRLIDTDLWSLTADNVLARVDRDSGVLELAKRLAEVPPDIGNPESPLPTPLPAGETFSEVVRVPLPVREWDQYERARGTPGSNVSRVRFVLGYHDKPPGTREEKDSYRGFDFVQTTPPPGTNLTFGDVASDVVTLKTPVPVVLRERHE
jgi:hypothetical protein